jgi:peptide/nickel transport system substrate-binding protein
MARHRFAVRALVVVVGFGLFAASCGDDGGGGSDSTEPQINLGSTTSVNTTTTLAPKVGGSITMGMFSETAGLDPVVTNGGGTTGTTEVGAIFDPLMRYDTDAKKYVPHMAESLTPNAENTEWTLKLRPNVKFSDGTDYDADAVVFGIKRHAQYASRAASLTVNIKDYAVVDKLTVKLTLTGAWAGFPYVLSYTPGMIPSPTAIKAACPDLTKPARDCDFNLKPVGAGPFVVDSYKPKDSITLKRNPTYWGGQVYLDSVKFVVLSGAPATYEALKTNSLQVGFLREPAVVKRAQDEKQMGGTYLNLQWMGGVALLNNGKVTCKGGVPTAVCGGKPDGVVDLNVITADKRIRQAVAYALDVDEINRRANDGAGFPGTEIVQKSSKYYSGTGGLPHDLEKAKALVEQVKKEKAWDGTIKVRCHNAPSRQSWAGVMQTLLTAAGFKVDLKNDYDTNALVADVLTAKTFEVACWGINMVEEAPEIALGQAVASTSPANGMNYQSPQMDALIKQVREAKTDADRKAAMDGIGRLWQEDMPTPVYEALAEMIAWRKEVHGLKFTVGTVVLFDKAWLG